jgi:hypothetical protein
MDRINFKPDQFRRQVGKSVDLSLCPSNLEYYVTAALVATKRMFALVTASQMASASAASFFCRLT